MNNILFIVLALFFVFSISGCPQEWFFSITDTSDPAHPKFCITTKSGCRGNNLVLAMVDVAEVNSSGEKIKQMWAIEARTNAAQKEYQYGKLPDGWLEITPAKPLELGKIYTFHGGAFYFVIYKSGDKYKSEVLSAKEFAERKERGHPFFIE